MYHLWKFDRFRCLKCVYPDSQHSSSTIPRTKLNYVIKMEQWTLLGSVQAPHDSASPLYMHAVDTESCRQYTYLFSVPCIMGYAIGFAVIKYQEGFVDLPGYGSRLYG